jgi:hypothetical protein
MIKISAKMVQNKKRNLFWHFGDIKEDPDFLSNVITCNETQLFQCDPETKWCNGNQ